MKRQERLIVLRLFPKRQACRIPISPLLPTILSPGNTACVIKHSLLLTWYPSSSWTHIAILTTLYLAIFWDIGAFPRKCQLWHVLISFFQVFSLQMALAESWARGPTLGISTNPVWPLIQNPNRKVKIGKGPLIVMAVPVTQEDPLVCFQTTDRKSWKLLFSSQFILGVEFTDTGPKLH